MNKQRLSTLGLIFITFLSAIQYVFLTHVPDTVPTFAFIGVTNLIGLVLMGAVFFKKLITLKKRTLLKGMALAALLTAMNFFMVLGSKNTETVIVSSLLSLYFIFVTPLLLLLKKKVNFFSGIATMVAILALLLMFGANTSDLFSSKNVIFLVICDIFFAGYVVSISILGEEEDSTQLTLAQMLFAFLFATSGWLIESFVQHKAVSLPSDPGFWVGAVFIGIFIRAVYGMIQMYSQKHVSALTASLIFSSEIIITLITNPIIYFFFGVKYTKATPYQVIGCFLFIIASLLLDENIMRRAGYRDMDEKTYVNEKNETVRFQPISKKIVFTTLTFTMVTLVVSTVVCLVAIQTIRDSAVKNSAKLGENAANISETAMKKELEDYTTQTVQDKAQLAEQKLNRYSGALTYAASYVESLYQEEGAYPEKEILAPDKKNAGTWTMQRGLADASISYQSLKKESMLLGNMEEVLKPITLQNENIATIYLGSESGLMFSYDVNSDNAGGDGEVYYEFRKTDWYKLGKEAKDYVFTDTYYDSFGRGLTITCVAPFKNKDGSFGGCIAMDILVKDLNESMVNDGIVNPNVATLINHEGDIIASKDISADSEETQSIFEDEDNVLKEKGEEILKQKNGLTQTGTGEDAYYIAYATITSTDWTLCIISPVSTVIKPAEEIREGIDENTGDVVGATLEGVRTIVQNFLVLVAVILLVVTGVAGVFSRRISDPLMELEKDVREISAGNLERRTEVNTDDEIGSLAHSFNHMTDSLQKYIVDLKEVTAKEERTAMELSVAKNIQESMLPRDFDAYASHTEFELYATMYPAKEVGGDFYDFFFIDENHLAILIADVSDKGVGAALFMAISKALIKMRAQMGVSPSEVIADVDERLSENNDAGMFVTVWLGIINLTTGHVRVCNAGHDYPAILHNGGDSHGDGKFVVEKTPHGPAVAMFPGLSFKEIEFDLKPGDRIYLYTDGVVEALRPDGERFGVERMTDILNQHREKDNRSLLAIMKEEVDRFAGEEPQFDDMTMLGFTYFGKAE